MVAGGLGLYLSERDSREATWTVGDTRSPNRVDLIADVQKLDPGSRTLNVSVFPEAQGDLASGATLSKELTLQTTSLERNGEVVYPAHQRVSFSRLRMPAEGIVTDYPFDRYSSTIGFSVLSAGKPVPVSLSLRDTDPFFHVKVQKREAGPGYAAFEVLVTRSRGSLILCWLMMIIMWALALAVLAATWILVGQRRGLVWPAMAWMAATLFALVSFRNAAPGSPPIGSVFDYGAFLWAELIVAASLVVATTAGVNKEKNA